MNIDGAHTFSSLHVATNGVVNCSAGTSNLNLTVTGNLTVDFGGTVSVIGLGYGPESGPGVGVGSGGLVEDSVGGGGHGGDGGSSPNYSFFFAPGSGGMGYDSLMQPMQWGSGGGNNNYGGIGGAGGGAMRLTVVGR